MATNSHKKKKILLAEWDCAMEDLWTTLAENVSGSLKQNGNKLLQDMFHKLKKKKKSSVLFCLFVFNHKGNYILVFHFYYIKTIASVLA